MTLFVVLGIVLTALAVALVVTPLLRGRDGKNAPVTATVMAIVLPAFIILLYLSTSNFNWNATNNVSTAAAQLAARQLAPDMADAIAKLEARLRDEPDDLDGWLLLGGANLQLQQFAAAEQAYQSALDLDGGNRARLGLAESAILMDRKNLVGRAGALVEEVLAAEPNNAKALFYGGMVASARDDPDGWRTRWEHLLALSPPPEVRRMIEAQLAGLGPSSVPASSGAGDDADDGGIDVRISVADALSGRINPGAMLFLVAREPGRPGPPVAVIRQSAANLPMTVRISDANAMLPGRTITALDRVQLIARIANGGNPVAQPGDISGEQTLQLDAAQADTVRIRMDQIVR